MADIKSIFNHPRQENSDKARGLYDWRKPAYRKDDVGNLNRLLKNLAGSRRTDGKFSAGKSSHVKSQGTEDSRRQRVIFKLSVGHSVAAHEKYIQTYMPQSEKTEVAEKPALFGTESSEYAASLDGDHFKCIISPENQDVDLELLARKFIERTERLTGYRLYWKGCIHTNTAHRHAHISINGTDKNGHKVRFAKEMIKTAMRAMLSEMATAMVGERTAAEIRAARDRLPQAARWTSLDERLVRSDKKIFAAALDQNLQNRLAFLSTIRLAQKEGGFFTLNPGWQNVLKASGRFNTFLEEFLRQDSLPLRLYEGGSVSGVVERTITFDKDESWNDAVIVRTKDARIYVPVYQLRRENLAGKTMRVSAEAGGLSRQVADRDIRVVYEKSYCPER